MKIKQNRKQIIEMEVHAVSKIFTKYADPDASYVADMIIQGIFEYTSEKIDIVKKPHDFDIIPVGNETIRHIDIKYTGYLLLCELGANDIQIEGDDWADVYSPSLDIRVECGVTSSCSLIRSFTPREIKHPDYCFDPEKGLRLKEYWVIPYPYPRKSPSSMLYKFTVPNKEKFVKYQKLRYEQTIRALERIGPVDYYRPDPATS